MRVVFEETSEDGVNKKRYVAETNASHELRLIEYDELEVFSAGRPYKLKRAWRANPWNNRSLRHDGIEIIDDEPELNSSVKDALLKKAQGEIKWV